MRFSRPDVACGASRFHGPSDLRLTKAQWLTTLNEDFDRATSLHKRSKSLQKISQLGHGTWSHFSFGDPVGNFKTDRALYGDTEARRRHLSRAERSGEMWKHPDAVNNCAPLPESASQLLQAPLQMREVPAFIPAKSPQRIPPSDCVGEAEPPLSSLRGDRHGPPEPPLSSLRGDRHGPPDTSVHQAAASSRETARPLPREQPAQIRQPPTELPQLWAEQPRYMTPNTPFSGASTGRSVSLGQRTPDAGQRALRAQIGDRLRCDPSRPPLRRTESDLGVQRGYINPMLRPGISMHKDPQGPSAADRYSTTLDLG